MSGKNIETVRRSLELWSNSDLEGFIEFLDPEIEWRTSRGQAAGTDAKTP